MLPSVALLVVRNTRPKLFVVFERVMLLIEVRLVVPKIFRRPVWVIVPFPFVMLPAVTVSELAVILPSARLAFPVVLETATAPAGALAVKAVKLPVVVLDVRVVPPMRTLPLTALAERVPLLVMTTLSTGSSMMLPERLVSVVVPRELTLPSFKVESSTTVTVREALVPATFRSTRPKLLPLLPMMMLASRVAKLLRFSLWMLVPAAWVIVPEAPPPPLPETTTRPFTWRLPKTKFHGLATLPVRAAPAV